MRVELRWRPGLPHNDRSERRNVKLRYHPWRRRPVLVHQRSSGDPDRCLRIRFDREIFRGARGTGRRVTVSRKIAREQGGPALVAEKPAARAPKRRRSHGDRIYSMSRSRWLRDSGHEPGRRSRASHLCGVRRAHGNLSIEEERSWRRSALATAGASIRRSARHQEHPVHLARMTGRIRTCRV